MSTLQESLLRSLWLGLWRACARYHRYEVEGFENLEMGRSALLVGYHGTPIAFDACILSAVIHDRLGYMPHGIYHHAFRELAVLRPLLAALGGVTGDEESLRAVVDRGEHIVLLPGGPREAARSWRQRYRVEWGRRSGMARLAVRYLLPIIPFACSGVDEAYVGLNDGVSLGRRVGMPGDLPLWFGVGVGGFWPFALPIPVRFRQVIGEPIWDAAEGKVDLENDDELVELQRSVEARIRNLVEQVNA